MPPHVEPIDTDKNYASWLFAEQIPLALAAFVFAKGKIEAIPVCVNFGRDCDTTTTTVGAWVGALNGESRHPKDWVDKVCEVNKRDMDLRDLAERIYLINE
jgi:ADP-ribosylglycohydrolase